ncbi:hypothetical protein ACKVMT_16710 [Halobacteriales archaeon Cl-PHB]
MVSRRRVLQASGVAIGGLAGCAGSTGTPNDGGDSTDETPTPDPPNGSKTAYRDLTDEQQQAFDEALAGDAVAFSNSLPDAKYGLDVAEPFQNTRYVLKNGTYYAVSTQPMTVGGGDHVSVEAIAGPDNETVVHLANETGPGYDLLQTAIESDGSAVRVGVDSPVETGTVLEYQGEYYRVGRIYHYDFGQVELEVEQWSGESE